MKINPSEYSSVQPVSQICYLSRTICGSYSLCYASECVGVRVGHKRANDDKSDVVVRCRHRLKNREKGKTEEFARI
jgi:hypothetical protein